MWWASRYSWNKFGEYFNLLRSILVAEMPAIASFNLTILWAKQRLIKSSLGLSIKLSQAGYIDCYYLVRVPQIITARY